MCSTFQGIARQIAHVYQSLPYKPEICFSGFLFATAKVAYTAILRKVVGKSVLATIPKGNMGYDRYTVAAVSYTHLTLPTKRIV